MSAEGRARLSAAMKKRWAAAEEGPEAIDDVCRCLDRAPGGPG